jgi:hypothetical protein
MTYIIVFECCGLECEAYTNDLDKAVNWCINCYIQGFNFPHHIQDGQGNTLVNHNLLRQYMNNEEYRK